MPVAAVDTDSNTPEPALTLLQALLGKPPVFELHEMLAPPVVEFFMDQLDEGRPAVHALTTQMRAGNLDGVGRQAFETGNQMAAAFLRGIELFDGQQLDQAAAQFLAALSISPDFGPAAFYLGACYAAAGRDQEATTWWRRALRGSQVLPLEHAALADALFRLGSGPEALALLRDAVTTWPKADLLRRRLAIAHTLEGDPVSALTVIEPYVARHSADHEAVFVALHAIFATHLAGESSLSREEASDRMTEYAASYRSARGPHGAIVEDWVAFVTGPGR